MQANPIRRQLTLADLPCSPEQDAALLKPIPHPLLLYFGGKWSLAPKIIQQFRPHQTYVEPYGGGGSVLLRKRPSKVEVYNEINPRVHNLFHGLRTHPEFVIGEVAKLGHDRATLKRCWEGSSNPRTDAAMYYRHSCLNHSGSGTNWCTGFGRDSAASSKRKGDGHLWAISDRLQNVTLENRPALEVIREYDSPTTLHYVDPTYLPEHRASKDKRHKDQKQSAPRRQYAHEMTEQDHIDLAHALLNCQGQVVLSGYPSRLYADLYEANGWQRIDFTTADITGAQRIESIWLSHSEV